MITGGGVLHRLYFKYKCRYKYRNKQRHKYKYIKRYIYKYKYCWVTRDTGFNTDTLLGKMGRKMIASIPAH